MKSLERKATGEPRGPGKTPCYVPGVKVHNSEPGTALAAFSQMWVTQEGKFNPVTRDDGLGLIKILPS